MAEYINRKALIRNLKQFAPEHLTPLIESLIQKQPAADVVEVVRCNYCKDNATGCVSKGTIWCVRYHARRPIDGYCSYGKPKEGDESVSKN